MGDTLRSFPASGVLRRFAGIKVIEAEGAGRWLWQRDQRRPLLDGEVALVATTDRPLSEVDFASIGAVVSLIERLVAGLTRGDASA